MTPAPERQEAGFFTIWVLGLCLCLFFIGGLSLDLWRGFTERRQVAAIVDAAATAGASQIDLAAFRQTPSVVRLDTAQARTRAIDYLDDAATEAGLTLQDVDVRVNDERIIVQAGTRLDLTLTRVFAPTDTFDIRVRSAAEPRLAQ